MNDLILPQLIPGDTGKVSVPSTQTLSSQT